MRALLDILSILGLLAWAPAPVPAAMPQPSATFGPHGGAYVTSLPSGASAWLDGAYAGETPVFIDDLAAGSHTLTLTRAGWQLETQRFDIAAGQIAPVSVVMRKVAASQGGAEVPKGQGMLGVRGGPAGSKVFVDGSPAGDSPLDPRVTQAGYHIVTLEPPAKNAPREMRIVDVYPETTTVVQFTAGSGAMEGTGEDDVLEPLDSVVPGNEVMIAGDVIEIHHQGVEVECAIGSRSYTLNGRAGTLAVAPALVAGRVYIPRSLLQRLGGK